MQGLLLQMSFSFREGSPEEVALEPESRGEPVSGADGTVWSRRVVEVWGPWGPDMEGGSATLGTAEEVLFHTGHQEPQNSTAQKGQPPPCLPQRTVPAGIWEAMG